MRLPVAGAVLQAALERQTVGQFLRYGLSGSAAALTQLAVLTLLVELALTPPLLASVTRLRLRHGRQLHAAAPLRVRPRAGSRPAYFPRYLGVTLATMGLNTLLFWTLTSGAAAALPAEPGASRSAVIVPINFVINRSFTFAT